MKSAAPVGTAEIMQRAKRAAVNRVESQAHLANVAKSEAYLGAVETVARASGLSELEAREWLAGPYGQKAYPGLDQHETITTRAELEQFKQREAIRLAREEIDTRTESPRKLARDPMELERRAKNHEQIFLNSRAGMSPERIEAFEVFFQVEYGRKVRGVSSTGSVSSDRGSGAAPATPDGEQDGQLRNVMFQQDEGQSIADGKSDEFVYKVPKAELPEFLRMVDSGRLKNKYLYEALGWTEETFLRWDAEHNGQSPPLDIKVERLAPSKPLPPHLRKSGGPSSARFRIVVPRGQADMLDDFARRVEQGQTGPNIIPRWAPSKPLPLAPPRKKERWMA